MFCLNEMREYFCVIHSVPRSKIANHQEKSVITGKSIGTSVCVALIFSVLASTFAAGETLKPEDVIARHLDSLGTAEARAASKSRVVEGQAHFKTLVGGVGVLDGQAVIVSEDRKMQYMLKFANTQYGGERFIFNGDKAQIAANTAGQTRSSFGSFVYNYDAALRDGLLGGALNSSWALLNVQDRKAKITYEGLRNIDGMSLHDLHYRPKKSGDLDIHLYFDSETFRHVLTVYTLTIKPQLAHHDPGINDVASPQKATIDSPARESTDSSEIMNARQQETRYRLEERFGNFNKFDGLMLPSHYDVHFTQEMGDGHTNEFEWDVTTTAIHNNVTLDPRNFQVK
jgi:hypothetical protein